ncbi:hypothetical protein OROGR_030440 [Orobanche gracilis]
MVCVHFILLRPCSERDILGGAVGRFNISSVRAECSESVVVNSP